MGKRITLNPLTNARRSASSGGGSSDLDGRVETLEEKVAGLEDFSLGETDTGKEWVDGKRIFRNVVISNEGVSFNDWQMTNFSVIPRILIDKVISGFAVSSMVNGEQYCSPLELNLTNNGDTAQEIGGVIMSGNITANIIVYEYTKKG